MSTNTTAPLEITTATITRPVPYADSTGHVPALRGVSAADIADQPRDMLADFYLDWANNYLRPETIAADYGLELETAAKLIDAARTAQDERAASAYLWADLPDGYALVEVLTEDGRTGCRWQAPDGTRGPLYPGRLAAVPARLFFDAMRHGLTTGAE